MIFIIGGAYQGKLDYAKEKLQITDADIFDCKDDGIIDTEKKCIYHFEEYIKFAYKKNDLSLPKFRRDAVVIMNDIFCGVVPVDTELRAYREFAGHMGTAITKISDKVIRVFCGLGQVLKTKTKKIYLIRHGKTKANVEYFYCGKSDLPLLPEGKQELENNKALINYPNADGIKFYTSSLTRTKQTLSVLYPNAEYSINPGFDEMDFGDFEQRKYDGDLESDQDFVIWTSGNNETNVCPHGESSMMMRRRVFAEFDKLLEDDNDSLVVCHGGPITAVFLRLIPDSGLNYYEIQPKNGEGYCIEFDGKKLVNYYKITKKEE